MKTKRNPQNSFIQQENKTKTKKYNPIKKQKRRIKKKDEEILKIARDFYSELYTKAQIKEQEQENFLSSYDRKISVDWHPNLTKPFEEKELFQALKSM